MVKFYADGGTGTILAVFGDDAEEAAARYTPPQGAATATVDTALNPAVATELRAFPDRYRYQAGALTRQGQAVGLRASAPNWATLRQALAGAGNVTQIRDAVLAYLDAMPKT